MFYKIVSDENSKGKIFISAYFYMGLNSNSTGISTVICFGNMKHSIKTIIVPDLGRKIIKISSDIIRYFNMPLDILYQVQFTGKEISIGPVIGLLVATHENQLNESKLNHLLEYTDIYSETYGLLYVFSSDGINFKDNLIDGYYYKTDDKGNPIWQKASLPFPSAVYRTVPLTAKIRTLLKRTLNNKVFNSLFIHKLDFGEITRSYNDTTINNLAFKEKKVNFKIIMQKNEFTNWTCTGIIVYLIDEKSTVNDKSNIIPYPLFAKEYLKVNEAEMEMLKLDIIESCIKVCYLLDATKELYGDVCIDAAIDTNNKIWISKINRKYDHNIPLLIKDCEMYRDIKITPVKYLIALSNFKIY